MIDYLNKMKTFIENIEPTASNKTRNCINEITDIITNKIGENDAILTKYMFYIGYSYAWEDRTTYLSCAGRYPSDEELKKIEQEEKHENNPLN